MRLSVRHTETIAYDPPSMGTIQVLRMTPRDHIGHYVCDWTVEVDADCKIDEKMDAFGNKITSFSLMGPLESVTIVAEGELETEPNHGIVRGMINKVPTGVFMRPGLPDAQNSLARQLAALVSADGAISDTPLAHMHALMDMLHAALPATIDGTPDANSAKQNQQSQQEGQQQQDAQTEAQDKAQDQTPELASRPDVQRLAANLQTHAMQEAADFALVLCDSARIAGLPSRLVSGYRLLAPKTQEHSERQVWAEVHIEDLGWVGFDPITNSCPSEESIRVAIGLDQHGIKPVRIGHYGNASDVERTTTIALAHIPG